MTHGHIYSGADDLDRVGCYKNNSRGGRQRAEAKLPNELGIRDKSGNVWQWCGDW